MKNFKSFTGIAIMFALLFSSCSKENDQVIDESEMTTLSFATVLNDLASKKAALKDHLDGFPACSDAAPAYVAVVLSGPTNVGTMEDPVFVKVNSTPGNYDGDAGAEYFTEESSDLKLQAGQYQLQHFTVYDGHPEDMNTNRIWVAPMAGSDMANFVGKTLPMDINLDAGVKKYVDVEVLCFDDRMVNEYGYVFFDIETNEAIEFCVFGNFCDESGRHYAAEYSVNVWSYANGTRGEQIYSNLENNVEMNADGDYAASPLCVALPDTQGMDEYYFEITLMDGEAYNTNSRVIRAGVINDDEVRSFFDGDANLDYYHFRTGCDDMDNVPLLQDPEDDATHYKARLGELNGSDSHGFAYLTWKDNVLKTTVLAYGVTPNKQHPQHIHGFEDDSNSVCPPASADEDGNGLISLTEGAPFYGPVLLPLTMEDGSFPMANSWGMYTYERTFTLGEGETISSSDLNPLENRVIVLHGMNVNGEYVATLPVSCGQIEMVQW